MTGGSFKYLADKELLRRPRRSTASSPGFVIQGGDPKGDGSGGPGYSVVEAPPRDLDYTKGVVAMAKTRHRARRARPGSQFFVVTGDEAAAAARPTTRCSARSPKGMDVVDKIGARPGRRHDEQPGRARRDQVDQGQREKAGSAPSSASSARLRSGPPP